MNNSNNNLNNKILIINQNKLIGIDKFIMDFSFLSGYIIKSALIIQKNENPAEFIQIRVLFSKIWTTKFRIINIFFYNIIFKKDESYFLDNFFLYDQYIFNRMSLKDYDENCNYVRSTVLHPFLFLLNLSILLYFQDNRSSPYLDCVYSKYNFDYKNSNIDFSKTNNLLFKEKYNNLLKIYKNVAKLKIKNFKNSITTDVFKEFVYKKYNIKWETLEIIINYSKTVCSDGSKIIPTLEFSPLYAYLTSYCVLEGLIEEILQFCNIKIDILAYDEEIYLFFNDFNQWTEIRFIVENILFKNKLELDYQNIETIKIYDSLTKINNKNTKIAFSDFCYKLIDYIKAKKNFINSRDAFLNFLKEENLDNPFYEFDIKNIDECEYKKILQIINSSTNANYFKMIDSNPKHFIRLFYLLDKNFTSHSSNNKKNYLLSKLVSKLQEYKYNSFIINDDYYLFYYLYNSFKGLEKNKINKNKFISNIDPFYVNFQNFVFNIFGETSFSYLEFENCSSIKIKHNNAISSLMFFLQNQFILHNYNDCILIVSTLYDLIKKKIKKIGDVKDYVKFLEFINNEILPTYKIDPINVDDWKKINKLRNGLTSCHIGSESIDDFKLESLEESLENIINWIFKSSKVRINNNFNKFLFCLEELIENRVKILESFNIFKNSSK